MPNNSQLNKIGIAILRVLAEKLVTAIPVVGPYASIGIDIYKAVKDEIEKERQEIVTKEQIIEAVQSLTYKEVTETVDSVLDTPKNKDIIDGLPSEQRQAVRKRLLSLPSEIDQLLANIEAKEKADEQRLKTLHQNEIEAKLKELRNTLVTQLERHQLLEAYRTVEQIIKLKPNDRDALKTEAFLYKRLAKQMNNPIGRTYKTVFATTLIFFGLALQTVMSIAEANDEISFFAGLAIVIIAIFIVGMFGRIWLYLPRKLRSIGNFFVALILGLSLMICLGITAFALG